MQRNPGMRGLKRPRAATDSGPYEKTNARPVFVSVGTRGMLVCHELDDLPLRPIPIVCSCSGADEAAVSAVAAHPKGDGAVAGEFRVAERCRGDKRIVFGGDDQRGDPDPIHDTHRARLVIVVFGAGEAEVRSRVEVVELADGADRVQPREIEQPRIELLLAPHPALEITNEV